MVGQDKSKKKLPSHMYDSFFAHQVVTKLKTQVKYIWEVEGAVTLYLCRRNVQTLERFRNNINEICDEQEDYAYYCVINF